MTLIMAEIDFGASSRDILIEVRGMVKQLVESRDDHEARIRAAEKDVADLRTTKREQAEATRRVLAWGMFLAAVAGAFGHVIVQAITKL